MLSKKLLDAWQDDLRDIYRTLSNMENTLSWYGYESYGSNNSDAIDDLLWRLADIKSSIKMCREDIRTISKENEVAVQ